MVGRIPSNPLKSCGLVRAVTAILMVAAACPTFAEESEPVFIAQKRDGKTVTGRLRKFDLPNGAVVVEGTGSEQPIATDALEVLLRDPPPAPPPIEDGVVLFPDGDRLVRAKFGNASDTSVVVQAGSLGGLPVPLDSILALVSNPPAAPRARAKLLRTLRETRQSGEALYLANGDKLTGGLSAFNDKSVKLQAKTGAVEIDRSGLVAIGFDTELVSYPKPKGIYAEVLLIDGSRIGLREARVESGSLMGYARFGPPVKVALGEIMEIRLRSDAIRYLSDDPPLQERYREFVGPTLPFSRDMSVFGTPLRMSGRPYEHGLGTQPRTLLAYRVGSGWKRFQATAGLDEESGPLANVVFRVIVDGKEAAVSPPLTVRDKPFRFDVPLQDAKLLVLITEFGERGNVQDAADWGEARLSR